VDNYQNGLKPENPTYASVIMQESDAICVAVISISGNGQQWTWTGDMAMTCGAQWMESEYTFQGSNRPIKCAWLDSDHSDDLIAKGMSLHIRDFTADQGLVNQYSENLDRLCKNTARMTFWPEIVPDSTIAIFSPELKYTDNTNEGNPDPTALDTTGSLTEPDEGKDRGNKAYPDGTDFKGWRTGKNDTQETLGAVGASKKSYKRPSLSVTSQPQRHTNVRGSDGIQLRFRIDARGSFS
jgi:hypothetical protein